MKKVVEGVWLRWREWERERGEKEKARWIDERNGIDLDWNPFVSFLSSCLSSISLKKFSRSFSKLSGSDQLHLMWATWDSTTKWRNEEIVDKQDFKKSHVFIPQSSSQSFLSFTFQDQSLTDNFLIVSFTFLKAAERKEERNKHQESINTSGNFDWSFHLVLMGGSYTRNLRQAVKRYRDISLFVSEEVMRRRNVPWCGHILHLTETTFVTFIQFLFNSKKSISTFPHSTRK